MPVWVASSKPLLTLTGAVSALYRNHSAEIEDELFSNVITVEKKIEWRELLKKKKRHLRDWTKIT